MAVKKKLGDIVEIPLTENKNAYARLYKEYTLGIYEGMMCLKMRNSYGLYAYIEAVFQSCGLWEAGLFPVMRIVGLLIQWLWMR